MIPEPPIIAATEDEAEAFDRRLAEARKEQAAVSLTTEDGREVVWSPLPGSQIAVLSCPLTEVLHHGTRGPGKTDTLLNTFGMHVGAGFGPDWRGILFRQTYPQLADVVAKAEKWFRRIFPTSKFNRAQMRWDFATGERLYFRHMRTADDYWSYHGHEYPWIGWEELTNWPDDGCYRRMFACLRSSRAGMPRMVRATTNPYGVGHNWIADRFQLRGQWWKTIVQLNPTDSEGRPEPPRAAIHGHIDENTILLAADPNYKQTIAASAQNKAMAEAWLQGSWDFVAGGMFDDVWNPDVNTVARFDVPRSWRLTRSFDWGSSKPFSVGWWAVSDGTHYRDAAGRLRPTVRGDLFRISEWYGSTGRPNEGVRMLATDVARGIIERELIYGFRDSSGCRVFPGVADSAIFTTENGNSIADSMRAAVRVDGMSYPGVVWLPADKRPGSRKTGWELMRKMIRDAAPDASGAREKPGLFVVGDACPAFLRTVLSLPRDDKDLDDVNTSAEDHVADETRYLVRFATAPTGNGKTVG